MERERDEHSTSPHPTPPSPPVRPADLKVAWSQRPQTTRQTNRVKPLNPSFLHYCKMPQASGADALVIVTGPSRCDSSMGLTSVRRVHDCGSHSKAAGGDNTVADRLHRSGAAATQSLQNPLGSTVHFQPLYLLFKYPWASSHQT